MSVKNTLISRSFTHTVFEFPFSLPTAEFTDRPEMAPQLNEEEIDDLLYSARVGDKDELTTLLSSLAEREKVSPAEILTSAKDDGKSTCLHMATGNGHAGE